MRIPKISKFLVIDEVPDENNESNVYLFTRPFDLSSATFSSNLLPIMYATPFVRSTMIGPPLLIDKIIIVNDKGFLDSIKLPDATINIRVMSTDSYLRNVWLYFDEHHILYTGWFTDYRQVLMKLYVSEYIRDDEVEEIYIDTTLANEKCTNSIKKACDEIVFTLNQFESYQIRLCLTGYGYEDLLMELAANQKKKIFLDPMRRSIFSKHSPSLDKHFCNDEDKADIIVRDDNEESICKNEIEKLFEEFKLITMRLTLIDPEYHLSRECSKRGLCLIQYSPHPSFLDLYSIVMLITPQRLHAIEMAGHCTNKIPIALQEMCCNFKESAVQGDSQNPSALIPPNTVSGFEQTAQNYIQPAQKEQAITDNEAIKNQKYKPNLTCSDDLSDMDNEDESDSDCSSLNLPS